MVSFRFLPGIHYHRLAAPFKHKESKFGLFICFYSCFDSTQHNSKALFYLDILVTRHCTWCFHWLGAGRFNCSCSYFIYLPSWYWKIKFNRNWVNGINNTQTLQFKTQPVVPLNTAIIVIITSLFNVFKSSLYYINGYKTYGTLNITHTNFSSLESKVKKAIHKIPIPFMSPFTPRFLFYFILLLLIYIAQKYQHKVCKCVHTWAFQKKKL